jgi:ElaB/YqjD/DUF883 family membrane-anchored ribosome-binding protein
MSEPVNTARLLEQLQAVVRDAEALLTATASQTGERVSALRARAEDSLQQARSHIADTQEELLQGARDAAAATENYIKKNPWQTLGIAVGVGLVIGLLLKRRD